jgi:putative NIF3 family GTP cyclohydrolase 1 type 2
MAALRIAQATPPAAGRGPASAPAGVPGRGGPPPRTGPVMAGELVDMILARLNTPFRPRSNDRFVAGDPLTPVTGIATLAMATFDGLKAAAAAKCNLILTADATWWGDGDDLTRLEGNATFKAKRDFIAANRLVVYRIADHLADTVPDPIAMGMAQALGWEETRDRPGFTLPPTTLLALSRQVQERLGARTLRVIGDPALTVSTVAAIWGRAQQMPAIRLLRDPGVDVLMVGYTPEWEAVLYAQDQVALGLKKGMILVGQVASRQDGMQRFADWVKTVVTEVPVRHITLAEAFWNLDQPTNLISTKI